MERTDLIAVKRLSNLASGQGEVAESRQLPDTFFREAGGKRIARDQYLLDGLRRLGLLEAVAHDGRGKGKLEWLLLHRQRLELPKRRRVYACEAALMAG